MTTCWRQVANVTDTPRRWGALRLLARETVLMSSQCRDCVAEVEHCHGTVIHHAYYGVECTEDGCVTPEVVHAFAIDCKAVGCTCDITIAKAI